MQSLNDPTQVNNYIDVYGIVYAMRKERVWMVQTEQQYICIHQCIVCILQQSQINGDQQELLDQNSQDLELINNTKASKMLAHHNRAFDGTLLILSTKTTAFIVQCGILWLNTAITNGIPTVVGGFWSKNSDSTTKTSSKITDSSFHNSVTHKNIIMTNIYRKSWWIPLSFRKSNSKNTNNIYCL